MFKASEAVTDLTSPCFPRTNIIRASFHILTFSLQSATDKSTMTLTLLYFLCCISLTEYIIILDTCSCHNRLTQSLVRLVYIILTFCFSTQTPRTLFLPMVTLARRWFKTPEDISPGCGFSREHQCSHEDNGGGGKQEVEKEEKKEDRWEDTQGWDKGQLDKKT